MIVSERLIREHCVATIRARRLPFHAVFVASSGRCARLGLDHRRLRCSVRGLRALASLYIARIRAARRWAGAPELACDRPDRRCQRVRPALSLTGGRVGDACSVHWKQLHVRRGPAGGVLPGRHGQRIRNNGGVGGVPALFKSFTQQAGLAYDVSSRHAAVPASTFISRTSVDVIGKRGWDIVVMHGYSTLDADKPRDPGKLIATSKQMADFLRLAQPESRALSHGYMVACRSDVSADRRVGGSANRSNGARRPRRVR